MMFRILLLILVTCPLSWSQAQLVMEPIREEWPIVRQLGGEWVTLGEVIIWNSADTDAEIETATVELLNSSGAVVGSRTYAGAELDEASPLGGVVEAQSLLPLFVWTTAAVEDPPDRARIRASGPDIEDVVTEVPLPVFELPFVPRLPVRGGLWGAINGIGTNYHWLTLYSEDMANFYISQRFAIDFVRIDMDLSPAPDYAAADSPEQFYGYGEPVFPIGPGRVVATVNDRPDTPVGGEDLDNPHGNYVVIEHAPGVFGTYIHFRPGSVRVAVNDEVDTNTLLGEVGNSGNSDLPHLHFQLTDDPDIWVSQGLPVAFHDAHAYDLEDPAFAPVPVDGVALPGVVGVSTSGRFTAGGVVNGATMRSDSLAPGLLFTIFGAGIGPAVPAGAEIGEDGRLETTLGTTAVLVDGVPAPLLYVSSSQINAQVPYEIPLGSEVTVQVVHLGELSDPVTVPTAATAPGIFTYLDGSGRAIVVNQDGSLNSPEHPADVGDIVTLYATGEGPTNPPGQTGALAEVPYPVPVVPVFLIINGHAVELLYAGSAPGLAGVIQINARVPSGATGEVDVIFTAGIEVSPTLKMYVR